MPFYTFSYSGSCLSKPQFDSLSASRKLRKSRLMPAPLSIDLRQRIIAAYEAKEGFPAERYANATTTGKAIQGESIG
jgi:hypothetical protein